MDLINSLDFKELNTSLEKPVTSATCLVVGSGPMGQAHAKANKEILPVGSVAAYSPSRKNEKAINEIGVEFVTGELESVIQKLSPSHAIVAAPVEKLSSTVAKLLSFGVKNILVEKPAFISNADAANLIKITHEKNANIIVGYNRRFYASVLTAIQMIQENNEVMENIFFEFTEWGHDVEKLDYFAPIVKERWALANSMHVIDTAFLLTGLPQKNKASYFQKGSCSWHPTAATMVGSGVTTSNATFSCFGNWQSPGRWGVEWVTNKRRYIFRPMEALKVQKIGSVTQEDVKPIFDFDSKHKPGVFIQNKLFLNNESSPLFVKLEHAASLVKLAQQIANYPNE